MHATDLPSIQGDSSLPKLRHRLDGIDQICVIAIRSTKVLAPQLQPQVARELPGTVSQTGWIDWFSFIALRVDHGA